MESNEMYVATNSINYYMLSSPVPLSDEWTQIDPRITANYVYFPGGNIAVYSEEYNIDLLPENTSLEMLICFACFCHILRVTMHTRKALLDDTFLLTIQKWRTPCETVVVYTNENAEKFYLEGCRERGLYWREIEERPKTMPPFVSCGASDQNGGCWMEECPHGAFYEDQDGPYRIPV